MSRFVVRDYRTGKVVKSVKLNAKSECRSLSYRPEYDEKSDTNIIVIRDYHTGEILQKVKYPYEISVTYGVE